MKYLIVFLGLFSVSAIAQDYNSLLYESHVAPHVAPHLDAHRQQNAVIIPRLGGGYTVVEPYGTTTVTEPDPLGTVIINRQGYTTW